MVFHPFFLCLRPLVGDYALIRQAYLIFVPKKNTIHRLRGVKRLLHIEHLSGISIARNHPGKTPIAE